jgi:tetratricopeptide (TPR) repeat protein
MILRRNMVLLICLLGLVLSVHVTLAQETPDPPRETLPTLQLPEAESAPEALPSDPLDLLVQGNAFYQQGAYEDAARAYQTALAYGVENEILHYNLGNALFRLGHLGPAIVEYERALLLAPGDPDIRANLAFAGAQAVDTPPADDGGPVTLALRWLRRPGVNGSAVVALIAYLAFSVLIAATLLWSLPRRGLLRALAAGALLLAIPPALVVAIQGGARELDRRAVVMSERIDCRSGPGETNPVLFAIHEGSTVEIVDERNGWSRVTLPDGLIGWLPGESVERIRPRQ